MLDSPIVTAATHPQEGACVYLRDIRDGSTTTATVVAWADEEALVSPDGPLAPGAQVALRHVHDGDAGQGRAVVRPSSLPGLLRRDPDEARRVLLATYRANMVVAVVIGRLRKKASQIEEM